MKDFTVAEARTISPLSLSSPCSEEAALLHSRSISALSEHSGCTQTEENRAVAVLKHGASACLGEILRNSHCDEKEMLRLQEESFKHDRILRFPLKQNVSNASAFLSFPSAESQLPITPHTLRHNSVSEKKR